MVPINSGEDKPLKFCFELNAANSVRYVSEPLCIAAYSK